MVAGSFWNMQRVPLKAWDVLVVKGRKTHTKTHTALTWRT